MLFDVYAGSAANKPSGDVREIQSITGVGCLISNHANAHKAGDWIIEAGPISVQPSVDSDPIDVAGLQTFENGVDVDNDVQLGLTGTYMLTDRWGIKLLAASPFSHDIELEDAPVTAGDTKHLPPTLSLQYYPDFGKYNIHPVCCWAQPHRLF